MNVSAKAYRRAATAARMKAQAAGQARHAQLTHVGISNARKAQLVAYTMRKAYRLAIAQYLGLQITNNGLIPVRPRGGHNLGNGASWVRPVGAR